MRTPSLGFDRWDYGVIKALLAGALVGVPLVLLGLPLLTWATGDPLVWTAVLGTDEQAAVTSPVRGGAEAFWDGSAVVTVFDASARLWVLTLLPALVVAVAAVLVTSPLLGPVRTIQRGDSFTGVANSAVLERAFDPEPSYSIVVGGGSLVISALGLSLGAMAEAFRQGVRLRDDVDGLV